MKRFEYSFSVPMHHVDNAGILFFANLFIHAHETWEAFMRSIGATLPQIIKEGELLIPIVHTEADYIRPMRHGDDVTVELAINRLGRSSIKVAYEFLDVNGAQLATAETTHVFVGADTMRSIEIPQAMRQHFEEFRNRESI